MTDQCKSALSELSRKVWYPAVTPEQKLALLDSEMRRLDAKDGQLRQYLREKTNPEAMVRAAAMMSVNLREFKEQLQIYKSLVEFAGLQKEFNEAYLKVKNEKYS